VRGKTSFGSPRISRALRELLHSQYDPLAKDAEVAVDFQETVFWPQGKQ